jgi:CHAT domain-containing protein
VNASGATVATNGVDANEPSATAAPPATASASQDTGDDGRLEARELMDIPLDADLVVLSACDTARGRIGAGEGVVGLSWAILLAGSASTIVSQWQVDAESTSSLMIGFHRALLHRPSASSASSASGAPAAAAAASASSASSTSKASASSAAAAASASGPPGVSTALRRAALELMRDPRYKHPFYWASFRVVGAP